MDVGKKTGIDRATKMVLVSIALIATFNAIQDSTASMPEISFACQVQHPTRGIELKLVQANSREEAVEIAHLKEESKYRIFEVKQCIIIGEETFKDSSFQRDFEKTPR